MTEVLSRRALNRATLARQYLLERTPATAIDAIEHLGGMQSQAPLAPYIGLWTRLHDFTTDELATLTEHRQVVRTHLMRNTVHLVSARDCLDWRALFTPLHAAEYAAHFPHGIDGVHLPALLEHARHLLAERPLSRAELGRTLAERHPAADPNALAHAVTHHIPLCQTPPRGIWGTGGPARWTPLASWLGAQPRAVPVDELVLRFLGAFGPATVADVQTWSGLTRLREVVERLPLQQFRDETGQTLHDLPDAPRPPEDTPAPPRFLPAYDNLLLSHRDRTRVIVDNRPVPLPPGNGATVGTFLIDGMWQGTWQVQGTSLHIKPFTELRKPDHDALQAEAARLTDILALPGNGEATICRPD